VDGFRFDLAAALARELYEVNRLSAFFDVVHQDPVLSQVKLIAEPWDIGEGGYQVGNFPVLWTEWNGRYRDAVRSYWKGEGGLIGDLAYRLTGSSDLYELSGRRPYASINFITCHDGFTLEDLVSYNGKHNEANLEDNRDGSDDNRSWNCGVEGPTSDPAVLALRARQKRNFLATLLLSQGVPMLLAGDETGRTQRGNNNAYCQDNEISWMSWNRESEDRELLSFVSELIKFRKSHPSFRRRSFFQGPRVKGTGVKDIVWLTPDGREMTDEEWRQSDARCLGLYLQGDATNEDDDRGRPVIDDDFIVLLNSHHEAIPFLLPRLGERDAWQAVLDTARANGDALYQGAEQFPLQARSLALLTRVKIGAVAAKIAEGVKLAASVANPAGR
jgi:glycogen operon protein